LSILNITLGSEFTKQVYIAGANELFSSLKFILGMV